MKISLAAILALGTLTFAPQTFALIPFFSFYGGAGVWQASNKGNIGESNTDINAIGLDASQSSPFFYLAFEHPVPLIPNVRLEYNDINNSGSATLLNDLVVGDTTFESGSLVNSDLSLSYMDFGLYYNILMFDFGVNFRQFDSSMNIISETENISQNFTELMPMLYGQTRIGLSSGIYTTGVINVTEYDNRKVREIKVALGWEKELSWIARFSAELGYRTMSFNILDNQYNVDVETTGPYLGLELKL